MTTVAVILLGLAGGVGAGARFVLDGVVRSKARTALPWGTITINVTGSFLLGLVAGALTRGAPLELQMIAGTGFLGGYTTFSTASVETVRLIQSRRPGIAVVNAAGTFAATLIAATAGMLLAGL
ncbi:CrcB family protein [Sinomonas sp. JGH33]|uniref:Fluoride-specific ion channel FluC n=1 Tax=Sinomonas terricola TaxID=3110330 RepID=A0ABU5T6W7_9MICC|nr:CrcB family protein [Sinomonas sp. JGH33]MEA5455407.1 CrcB family protein [Sinomonas sp. JGH33]